jgi:subtilisin family serine protease
MKTTISLSFWALAYLTLSPTLSTISSAQSGCSVSIVHDEGYTSTISSVTDNEDDSYTITLIVESNGCIGCKEINRYSIQAEPGSYSDISVESLSGNFSFSSIDTGPNVRCFPFSGFGLVGIEGLGDGQPGSFSITYTLTGELQNQVVQPRAFLTPLPLLLSSEDFQAVLDCDTSPDPIVPYYPPLDGGKSFDIIGSELTSLYNTFINTGTYISDDIFQIVGSSVVISLKTQSGQYNAAVALLTSEAYGLSNLVGNQENRVISGLYPIENLLLLNELPSLLISAGPVYAPLRNIGFITSQGDTAMRSFRAREVFGLDGSGVKVGVLSDSYNTQPDDQASDDVERGDLPGELNDDYPEPVEVLFDYPLGIASDEGRAMLQIIHDVAPGASLAFRTGFLGPVDFANGIVELQEADCDIIVDDITYISEPFFRDGIVAQAVDVVNAAGSAYFSAAGNFGNSSWEGEFFATDAPSELEGEAHDFSGGESIDIYQQVTVNSGDYTLVLQWDDGTPEYDNTASDFDIYLVNDAEEILFGFNRVNTGDTPIEVLPFTVEENNTTANFLIVRASGSGPAALKYVVYRGNVEINEYATPNASTIVGQANAAGAIAVGAVDYQNTPEFGGSPVIESFSSLGGTLVNGVDRMKPEISGPNRVNTSVDLGGDLPQDDDDFFNFVGTSAAAPHAAGMAALILEARSEFFGDSYTPAELKNLLQISALDLGEPGYDPASGAGFILADSALSQLANPAPFLTGLAYDTTLIPGVDTLQLTIFGEYLKSGAQIYLNGMPLDIETNLLNGTTLVSTIPPTAEPFPSVQVFNPSKEGTNGSDGGLSNPLFFNSKQIILVQIDDAVKPFGAGFPEFTASYSLVGAGENIPLDSSDLTQAEIDRIESIELTTVANTLSNAGLWAIEPSDDDPLNPESDMDPTDTLDISLLERFDFIFDDGILTIVPLNLIITPRDTIFVYNDSISELSFDYVFSTDSASNLAISESDSLAITSALISLHQTNIPARSAIVRGTALVNEFGEPLLNAELLLNTGFFVTTEVRQSRGTALVNGELIDPEIFYESVLVEPTTQASSRIARGTALVNTFRLVRGTALVNTVDSNGVVVETTELSDAGSLTNSTGFLNPAFINENSNSETVTILGESDIAILSGDSIGVVETIPINLVTGNTVGEHFSLPGAFLTNNFNVQYGVGIVTILPDTLEIEIDETSLVQTYDGSPKEVSVSVMPDSIPFQISYNGSTDIPINAGDYEVEVSVLDSNYVGTVLATLTIEKVIATVSTGVFVIDEGNDLPTFTAEFDGFINEDDESVITSLNFNVMDFEGEAGVYEVIPIAEAENYSFEPEAGVLYVNPAGDGAKPIKIKFLCLQLLDEPLEGDFNYIATFGYRNLNLTPVFIPLGMNNHLSGNPFEAGNLPEVFLPGDNMFEIPFKGSIPLVSVPLSWTVISNGETGTESRTTNVTETYCEESAKSNDNDADDSKEDKTEIADLKSINVYPNPSSGIFTLSTSQNSSALKTIEVFDLTGKKHRFELLTDSSRSVELNLEGLAEGIYLLKIRRTDGTIDSSKIILRR